MRNVFRSVAGRLAPENRDLIVREPLGPVNRYTLLIPLCMLGILIANVYSLLITNNGLLISNIFPDLRVFALEIPQAYATFVFALVLQFGIMVLYFLFAVTRVGQKLLILPFLVTLAGVSVYFGFLSVHSHARGDAYVGSLPKQIDNLTAGIQGESQLIASSVNQALQGNLRLAESSRRGEDKTGVARCGTLCQGYFQRAEAIRAQYGHLLTVPPTVTPSSDLREQWRTASTQFTTYVGRARDYDRFLKSQDAQQGYKPSPALQEAHASLQQTFGKGLDDRWTLTAHSLGDILRDVSVLVSALIAIMPDVINLALAMTISTLLGLSRRGVLRRRPAPRTQPPRSERRDPPLGSLPVLPAESLSAELDEPAAEILDLKLREPKLAR